MRGWIELSVAAPLDGQNILPYHEEMEYEEWLEDGVLPVMEWDEENNMAWDYVNEIHFEITHWLPLPPLPTVKKVKE